MDTTESKGNEEFGQFLCPNCGSDLRKNGISFNRMSSHAGRLDVVDGEIRIIGKKFPEITKGKSFGGNCCHSANCKMCGRSVNQLIQRSSVIWEDPSVEEDEEDYPPPLAVFERNR